MFLFRKYIKPSFIIVGGVKCGTSSLYRHLNQHPNILPCKIKEPHIFSTRNVFKTLYKLPWYYGLFPQKNINGWVKSDWVDLTVNEQLEHSVFKKQKKAGVAYISGEASAETFVKAYPLLVKTLFPNIKLIVLLRNPTNRFISHYKMNMRFAKAGRKQHQLLSLSSYLDNQIDDFKNGNHKNVLGQGIYVNHLNKWLKYFSKNAIHISETKDLSNPATAQSELNNIFNFLGLDKFTFKAPWVKFNVSKKEIEIADEKARLDEFYQAYNKALSKQFDINF